MPDLEYIANRVIVYVICGLLGAALWQWRRK